MVGRGEGLVEGELVIARERVTASGEVMAGTFHRVGELGARSRSD